MNIFLRQNEQLFKKNIMKILTTKLLLNYAVLIPKKKKNRIRGWKENLCKTSSKVEYTL